MRAVTVVPRRGRFAVFGSRNAAARMNGISYSRLVCGLSKAGVEVNRKMLADIAVNDAAAFAQLVAVAKENL